MSPIRLALLGLRRQPVAALLAAAGVALSVGLGGALLQLRQGLQDGLLQVDPGVDVVLAPKSAGWTIFLGAMQLGDYVPDVFPLPVTEENLRDRVEPLHSMPIARFASSDAGPVVGVTKAWWERPDGVAAPVLASGQWPEDPSEAVVGAAAARRAGLKVGDTLAVRSDLLDYDGQPLWTGLFTVSGVLAPGGHGGDRGVYVGLEVAQEVYRQAWLVKAITRETDVPITHMLLTLDPNKPDQHDRLFQTFNVRRAEQVVYVRQQAEELRDWLGTGGRAGLAILALWILIAAAMVTSVLNERFEALRGHLGVMRAYGYPRSHLALVLAVEAAAILLLGLAGGVAIDRAASLMLERWAPDWFLSPAWPLVEHGWIWGGVILAAFLFTLVPIARLYRQSSHLSLKGL